MILKDFLRRWRSANPNGARLSLLSKLMLSTTWNFFIAIVVFIVASYLLLPHFLHQEIELKRLRQEIDALNSVLDTAQLRPDLATSDGPNKLLKREEDERDRRAEEVPTVSPATSDSSAAGEKPKGD